MKSCDLLRDISCVVFDVETTGFGKQARILELAAVRLEKWIPVAEFNTLINPEKPIPFRSTQIHKITEKMVAKAPTFGQIAPSFAHFLQDAILVGHNIFAFDLRFIQSHFLEAFGTKPNHWAIDTLPLARALLTQHSKFRLELLAQHFEIPIDAHQAMSDVYATAELWLQLSNILIKKGLRNVTDLTKLKSLRKIEGEGLPLLSEKPPTSLYPREAFL